MSDDFDKDDLDWLRDTDDDSDQPGDDDKLAFDWQGDKKADSSGKSGSLGVTGELSWLQEHEDAAGGTKKSGDDESFDWMTQGDASTPQQSGKSGVTGQLSWLQPEEAAKSDTPQDEARSLFESQLEDVLKDEQIILPPSRTPQPPILASLFDDDDSDEPESDEAMGELPPWMQGMTDDLTEDEEVDLSVFDEPAAAQADMPDWMRGAVAEDDDEDEHEPAAVTASVPIDLPDWMRGAIAEDDDEQSTFEQAASNDDAMPDWMRGAIAEEDRAPTAVRAQQIDDDDDDVVPSWMRDATLDDEEDEDEALAVSASADDSMPDWMRSADLEPVAAQASYDDGDSEDDLDAIPDWLMGAAPAELEDDEPDFASSPDFDLDSLFGDSDDLPEPAFATFADDENDDFDLLGQLTEGADDFDFLGELSAAGDSEDAAEDDFAALFADIPQSTAVADELDFAEFVDDLDEDEDAQPIAVDDFDFLTQLNAEEPEDDFAAFLLDDPEPIAATAADFFLLDQEDDDSAQNDDMDIDALLGLGNFPQPTQAESAADDFLSWFEQQNQPSPIASAAEGDDMAWLQDVEIGDDFTLALDDSDDGDLLPADDDFLADFGIDAPAPLTRTKVAIDTSFTDLDSFLASIDTGEFAAAQEDDDLLEADVDLDLDSMFSDLGEAGKQSATSRPLAPADAPDWLAGLSVSVGEALSAASIVRKQKDRPLEELPDRLKALHERGLDLPAAGEASVGILPIGRDTLPTVRVDSSTLGIPGAAILTENQLTRSTLLQSIVGSRSEAAPAAAPTRRAVRLPLERLLIVALLALAVILPFFVDSLQIGELPPPLFTAGTRQQAFFDTVNTLDGDYVLVAAEYAPTGAAELDEATEAVLRHLLARGLKPVIVGGNPAGLLHAGNIADSIGDPIAGDFFQRNQDYYVGRYLTGETIGLRAFAGNIRNFVGTDVRGDSTGLTLNSLDDFAAIIVIAERADTVRGWMEQIAPITSTPMLVVTGASAATLVEPYLTNASGLLVGYQDAYTYRSMLASLLGGIIPTTPQSIPATEEITPESTSESIAPTPQPTAEITAQPLTEIPAINPTATEEIQAAATSTSPPTATEPPTATVIPSNTPTATATATATPEPVQFGVVTANQRINVRSGPSTSESAVTSLAPGDRVLIIGQNEDVSWYQIRTDDGTEGWVTATLLRIELGEAPTATPASKLRPRNVPRQQEPTATPEITPLPLPPNESVLAEITPEVTLPAVPDVASLPFNPDAAAAVALIEDTPYRDERWYGMTLGIVAAVAIIILGNLGSLFAALRRSLARRRK